MKCDMKVDWAGDTNGTSSLKRACARADMTHRERFRQVRGMRAVYDWGGLSSVVLGGGESPLHGEGLDGST